MSSGMFDETLRTLCQLEGRTQLSVPIEYDEDGYLDRECPSEECLFQFKVLGDDWAQKVRDEEVFCPSCGHTAESGSWLTQKQVEHIEKAAVAHLSGEIGSALARDASQWNRRQRKGSLISITMKVNQRPTQVLLPPAAAEPMRLKITCPACECRYAVIGAAFFCPSCGHNAADLQFSQSVTGIIQSLDAIGAVRAAIAERDTAENTVRLLVENGLQNAVTAFQRYAEALYASLPTFSSARRNAFQNLAEGSGLWLDATGKAYADHLSATELAALQIAFQQRHLLAHTQGIVDADYLQKSGDTRYRSGQRIIVRENGIRETIQLISKLADALLADASAARLP